MMIIIVLSLTEIVSPEQPSELLLLPILFKLINIVFYIVILSKQKKLKGCADTKIKALGYAGLALWVPANHYGEEFSKYMKIAKDTVNISDFLYSREMISDCYKFNADPNEWPYVGNETIGQYAPAVMSVNAPLAEVKCDDEYMPPVLNSKNEITGA